MSHEDRKRVIEAKCEGNVYQLRIHKWGGYALFGPYHETVGDFVPTELIDEVRREGYMLALERVEENSEQMGRGKIATSDLLADLRSQAPGKGE